MSNTIAVVKEKCQFSPDGIEVNWYDQGEAVKGELADLMIKFGKADQVDQDPGPDMDKLDAKLKAAQETLAKAQDALNKSKAQDKSKLNNAVVKAQEEVDQAEAAFTAALEG